MHRKMDADLVIMEVLCSSQIVVISEGLQPMFLPTSI